MNYYEKVGGIHGGIIQNKINVQRSLGIDEIKDILANKICKDLGVKPVK